MSTERILCRLCALDCENYVNIYEKRQDSYIELDAKIASCLQIRVSRDDILPKKVCQTCFVKLENSFEFFQTSNKAQSWLEQIYVFGRKSSEKEKVVDDEESRDYLHPSGAEISNENRGSETESDEETQIHEDSMLRTNDQCSQSDVADTDVEILPADCDIEVLPSSKIVDEDVNLAKAIHKKPRRRKKDPNSIDVPAKPRSAHVFEGYPWSCTMCEDTAINSLQELRNHYKVKHQQPPVYKCISCDKKYDRYRSFSRHIKTHRNQNKYTCDICGKSFNHKTTVQNHATVHTDERPHVCQTCGKSFKNLSSLNVHEKKHQPNQTKRRFPCDICQKEFSAKHSLENHKNLHSGERGFICDICGRSFFAKSSLDYHIRSHTAAKNHICSTCGKGFRSLGLLGKHMTLHTGIKPHQCDVCGRQFRERGALREHNRIHTGDMPYTCEYCGKCFRFKGILTVHRRQHTGERPYACLECRRYFTNWANYNKHMKRIHHCDTSSRIIAKRNPSTNNAVVAQPENTESNKSTVSDNETNQCSISNVGTSQI